MTVCRERGRDGVGPRKATVVALGKHSIGKAHKETDSKRLTWGHLLVPGRQQCCLRANIQMVLLWKTLTWVVCGHWFELFESCLHPDHVSASQNICGEGRGVWGSFWFCFSPLTDTWPYMRTKMMPLIQLSDVETMFTPHFRRLPFNFYTCRRC